MNLNGPWRCDDDGKLWSTHFASPIARDVYVDCRPLIVKAPTGPKLASALREMIRFAESLEPPSHITQGMIEVAKQAIREWDSR